MTLSAARRTPRAVFATLAVVSVASITACGSDAPDDGSAPSGRVIHVPGDQATIQAGVDQARPGDLVLIDAGTYSEAVIVDIERITVRGVDRNAVILDGGDTLANGIYVTAGGVAVENLTVRSYVANGIIFDGSAAEGADEDAIYGSGSDVLDGYRASYITAYNNGSYGIYAFASRNGEIDHSLTSGHPDSGIYVGQCKPCNVVVHDVVSEHNAIGYYGTNASGGVYVVNSVFRGNRLGMAPNSQDMEQLAPQEETVIAGNLVVDNGDPHTPAQAQGFFGGGIAVGGGNKDVVLRNRVEGNPAYGIGLVELNPFEPQGNRVEANVLAGNGTDLIYQPGPAVTDAAGNCFTGNSFATSVPAAIEDAMPCSGDGALAFPIAAVDLPAAPPGVDYRTLAAPAEQPSLTDAASVPATSPPGQPTFPDLDAIAVPETS